MSKILDAVAYLKKSLIEHREIRANNVLIGRDGSVKLSKSESRGRFHVTSMN